MSKPTLVHADDPWERELVMEAWRRRDGAAFAGAGYHSHVMADLVLQNWAGLRERGMLPAALVGALTGCKGDNRRGTSQCLERMLLQCALECGLDNLRAAGAPADYGWDRRLTVYRGVSGPRGRRRVRGVSWTSELDCACWFARRRHVAFGPSHRDDPAVYVAVVGMSEVYCHVNTRNEHEYLVRPERCRRMRLSARELGWRSRRWADKIKERNSAVLSCSAKK